MIGRRVNWIAEVIELGTFLRLDDLVMDSIIFLSLQERHLALLSLSLRRFDSLRQ